MTDPGGWTSPGGWTAPGGPPANQFPTAVPHGQQNWGLSVPGYAVPGYVVLVPRPPRPQVVSIALALTYFGVVVSGLNTVGQYLYTWAHRDRFMTQMGENQPPPEVMSTAMTVGIVIGVAVWALAAAGTVVCAVLTGRGRNPARIVLACLAGLFALSNLCGSASGLLARSLTSTSGQPSPFNVGSVQPVWWQVLAQGILGVVSVTMLVLLLLPPTNRYFSPGPGRRFAPAVPPEPVPRAPDPGAGQWPGGAGHTESGR